MRLKKATYKSRFYYNDNLKVAFILIPKCASSSLRKFFKAIPQNSIPFEEVPDEYTKICILRDPLEKFISGYLEYKKREINALNFYDYIVKFENEGSPNEHTDLMVDSLNGLKPTDFDFIFKLEDINYHWPRVCEHLNIPYTPLVNNNSSPKNSKDRLFKLLQQDKNLKKTLLKLIEPDMKLIQEYERGLQKR